MRGKAKAYDCGYIFRFDLKLKTLWCGVAIARWHRASFPYRFLVILEKIKNRNIGEYSNGKKAVPKTVGSTPLKRDM